MKPEVEFKETVRYDLTGRAALITGGASGLGLATARKFLSSNGRVVIADYSDSVLEVAKHLAAQYGKGYVYGIKCDVTNEEDIAAAVALCVEKFGELDILDAACHDVASKHELSVRNILSCDRAAFDLHRLPAVVFHVLIKITVELGIVFVFDHYDRSVHVVRQRIRQWLRQRLWLRFRQRHAAVIKSTY